MPIERRRGRGLLLAAAVHLGLLALLHGQLRPPARIAAPAAEPPPLVVRLLWPQEAEARVTVLTPPTAAHAAAERPTPAAAPVERPVVPPQPAGQPVPQAITLAVEPAASAASSAREAPLNLALPAQIASAPPSVRSQALNDPRTNTRRSYSERFAATLGTDQTPYEEALPGGRRFRKGNQCLDAYESQSAKVDPFGPPKPNVVRSCN